MSRTERRVIPADDPPPELVERCLEECFRRDLVAFAENVEIARLVFHDYPEFVTAKTFPKRLRKAYVAQYGNEPEINLSLNDSAMDPAHRESLRSEAYECAKAWMDNGIAVDVLSELGLKEESAKLQQLRDNDKVPFREPAADPKVVEELSLMVGIGLVRMMEASYGKDRVRELSDELERKHSEEALLKGTNLRELAKAETTNAADIWNQAITAGTIMADPATKVVQ